MSFFFTCPECTKVYSVPDHWRGNKIRCPGCQKVAMVEDPQAAKAAPAPPVEVNIQRSPSLASRRPLEKRIDPRPPRRQDREREESEPLHLGVVIGVAAGLVLLVGGGGAALWWGLSRTSDDSQAKRSAAPTGAATRQLEKVAPPAVVPPEDHGGGVKLQPAPAVPGPFDRNPALNPPPAPVPPPPPPNPPLGDAELAKALDDLKSGQVFRQHQALHLLARQEPRERRKDVAQALEALLGDHNFGTRMLAAQALANWAIKENVPGLLKAMEDSNFAVRHAAIKALGLLRDERAVKPIAQRLTEQLDRMVVSQALQDLGPVAEKETIKHLKDGEWTVRLEACKILKVIGTKDSVAALQAATLDENPLVADTAKDAVKAARGR